MAKRSRNTSERIITRRLREGRGQGNGATYKPWLTVQDVPSQGLTHRIKGWTTERVHHLFSNLERDVFYLLDWSECILDIREQYPLLPLGETEAGAKQVGVRHPTDPHTQQAVVMTTDFLLDVQEGHTTVQQARTVKPADQLDNPRVLEKLEIERRYWQSRGVDWGIVTEHEISTVQAANIRLLHGYQQIDERLSGHVNLPEVIQFLLSHPLPNRVGDIVESCDGTLQLIPGTALTVLYQLLATHQVTFNLAEPLTDQTVLSVGEVVQS